MHMLSCGWCDVILAGLANVAIYMVLCYGRIEWSIYKVPSWCNVFLFSYA